MKEAGGDKISANRKRMTKQGAKVIEKMKTGSYLSSFSIEGPTETIKEARKADEDLIP